MNTPFKHSFFFLFCFALGLSLFAQQPPKRLITHEDNPNAINGQYMVVLTEAAMAPLYKMPEFQRLKSREAQKQAYERYQSQFKPVLQSVLQQADISASKVIKPFAGGLNGFVVRLTPVEVERLLKLKTIWWIEQDIKVIQKLVRGKLFPISTQETDWGVAEVGSKSGVGKCALVVDTGIDLDHPDLNVNSSLSASFVSSEPSADDQNGHGTHVAGIIAAKDNNFGTKGVAAGATVIAVKVLDRSGNGDWSDVNTGATYAGIVGQAGDVINMSLGGAGFVYTLDFTIRYIINPRGIYTTIAAGNDNSNASNYMPARVNASKVFTISNMTEAKSIAASSNFGNGPVDYAAPGTDIRSTDLGGTYSEKSGTSMAAPHVAGILLVNNGVIRTNGTLLVDKDPIKDKIASVN